jgi:hypothetical protein
MIWRIDYTQRAYNGVLTPDASDDLWRTTVMHEKARHADGLPVRASFTIV